MLNEDVKKVLELTANTLNNIREYSKIGNKTKAYLSTEKELNKLLINVLEINADFENIFKISGGYIFPISNNKWLKIVGTVSEINSYMYYENNKAVNCLLENHKKSITFTKIDECYLDVSDILIKMNMYN